MLNTQFKIGDRVVGGNESPYVIAEASSNFNQSKDIAFKLIDVAHEAGADAVKFQLFRADVLYPDHGEMYDVFKSIELNSDWLPELMKHAEDRGLQFSASAFDRYSISALIELNVPFMKVASSETTNLDLVARMAATGKPLFLSTGMCDIIEIVEAVELCISLGLNDISLMQCQAQYPLDPIDANISAIDTLKSIFGGPVGFSDHTLGISIPIAAVGRGAATIEKHFTLDRNMEGPDHFYALEPNELKSMIDAIRTVHLAIGSSNKEMTKQEQELGRRLGLWMKRPKQAGELITEDDLQVRRPAIGVKSRYIGTVIGAKMKNTLDSNQPICWSDIDFN